MNDDQGLTEEAVWRGQECYMPLVGRVVHPGDQVRVPLGAPDADGRWERQQTTSAADSADDTEETD